MLDRVAMHQSRFRTPGVGATSRGVVLGERLALLFPSLDRLVSFFRAYAGGAGLAEVLPTLTVARVKTRLRTTEFVATVAADSADRADRVASFARLAGGLAFTGSARHFVRYRDALAPLGYDVRALSQDDGDYVLYDDAFEQAYAIDKPLAFRDLALRLSVHPARSPHRGDLDDGLVVAEPGLAPAVLRYLYRSAVDADVALGEWPAASAFDDGPRRLHLFAVRRLPERMVRLFSSMPGVTVFVRPVGGAAVELDFEHPIPLSGAASAFASDELVLFRHGERADVLSPLPPFARVASLVAPVVEIADAPATVRAAPEPEPLQIPLRLRPTVGAPKRVVATLVDAADIDALRKLLYLLPQSVLGRLRLGRTARHLVVIADGALDALPLGTPHRLVADRTYVPVGLTLEPALDEKLLRSLLHDAGRSHVFLGHYGAFRLDDDALRPVLRDILTGVVTEHAEALPLADDLHEPLPSLTYDVTKRAVRDALDGDDR